MNNATANNIAAANNNAVIASMMVATGILCRWDGEKNKPVVFNTNKMEGGMIESWISGDPVMVPLSYYHTTLPMAAADEKLLAARYAKATGDKNVQIRHRLPRTVKEIPNRIARTSAIKLQDVPAEAPAAPVVAEAPAPAPVVETPPAAATPAPAAKAARRQPARAAKKNRGGSRKSAARPIGDVAPAPAAPVVGEEVTIPMRRASDRVDPANLEAKVNQLADVVANLAAALGAKVVA